MHLLPILWETEPTPADWAALSAAREALGFAEKIQPARALPGSPGRVLVIGPKGHTAWISEYAEVSSTTDPDLPKALGWCLGLNEYERAGGALELMNKWLGPGVKLVGEEEYDGPGLGFN